MSNRIKKANGITLIALVVTIVILVILGTISVNLLIKDGGIISKAKESAVINAINQKKELVQMAITTKNVDKLSGEKDIVSVEEVLGEIQKSENSTAIYAMKDNKTITATEGTTTFGASFLFPKETTGINTGIRIDVDDKLNITNAVKAEVEEATKEESAGIYDSEGNLLASWDRLEEEYNLDIEENSQGNSMDYVLNQDEFKDKTGLKIIIPEGVTSIGRAFRNCSNLTSIEIPEGVTTIGKYTFIACSNLTSVEIPEGVTSIEYRAFAQCSSLTNIEIPSSVTTIGSGAFLYCSNLEITVPSTVETIEDESAFKGCKSVTYEEGREKYFDS